ncbi:MAG: type VI secretion system protein TssA [Gemmatimonadaceae bacterium]|nr:type VI secretion system protein TssA [Gemmatimonadaceae bacterium]
MPLRSDLLDPIAGETPGGVDLRYDPVYDQIKEARREEDDLPQGDWVRTRKLADWPLVERLAGDAIAKRSKDLQLAVWLVEAQIRREGAAGLRAGTALVTELMDRFWEHCFPAVEDGDLEMRAGPLEWLASPKFLAVLRQHMPLDRAGHAFLTHVEGRKLGTEESVAGDAARKAAREEAIEAGRVPPEVLDTSLGETPKAWLKALVGDLAAMPALLERLDAVSRERFGDDVAPSYQALRDTIEEISAFTRGLLARKLEQDPDPPEPEPSFDAGATDAGGPTDAGPAVLSADVTSGDDAAGRIAQAARWMRQQDPTSPAPYLLVRGFRWGELRANRAIGGRPATSDDTIDPRLLVAPTTAVRSQLKSFALDGKWRELLEACEGVMTTPQGRGWLDLQRYALTAMRELGEEYAAAAQAVRGALAALLRDRPTLVGMTMMDDAPTANAETQAWLASEIVPHTEPSPVDTADIGGGPAGLVDGERPRTGRSAYDRALEEVRGGRPQRAIELLMRELSKERTPRGRFLRRIEIAHIMVDAGLEAVAQPMLEELQQLIETHQLELWEAGDVVAQPLALLYRVYVKLGWDEGTTQPLYLRIARLDPLAAMAVSG